jgi:hypothetical protein
MPDESSNPGNEAPFGLVDAPRLLEAIFPNPACRPSLRWLRDQQKRRTVPFVRCGRLIFFDVNHVRRAWVEKSEMRLARLWGRNSKWQISRTKHNERKPMKKSNVRQELEPELEEAKKAGPANGQSPMAEPERDGGERLERRPAAEESERDQL